MNKELATILKQKIAGLPFIDKLAGLVQTVEDLSSDGGDVSPGKTMTTRYKFPVSYDVTGAADGCHGIEKDLVPDSSYKCIIYFEDFGTKPVKQLDNNFFECQSQLRLICWLNRDRLVGDAYKEVTAYCVASLLAKLCKKNQNIGVFTQLSTKATNIPAQNSDLFSRYNYDQTVRQYLRPPFEFFGIDLVSDYKISINCFSPINFNVDNNCS